MGAGHECRVNEDICLAGRHEKARINHAASTEGAHQNGCATTGWSQRMTTAYLFVLSLVLTAYCGYYWTALTTGMIVEARRNRLKRHLDWTAVSRRGLSRSDGWRFW